MAFKRMVFDIETAPIEDADHYIEPATAPANYKDPEKIAAYIAERNAEAVGKCSLDPDLCRVVAVGWWIEGESPVAHVAGELDECDILDQFWSAADGKQLVGFNCLAFDLPVLLRRSLYLRLHAPTIQIDRFRHPQVDDLQQILSFNGAFKFHGLSFYAKRFGCLVEDALTGADIGAAVDEGRWADVRAHVLADIEKTAYVAAQCGYFDLRTVVMR